MNDRTGQHCPRVEDVSALMDGAASVAAANHVARCPLCGALLREFQSVSAGMRALRNARCDVDLAALVVPGLPARMKATRQRAGRWEGWRQVVPRGAAAAGALAAGAYLGLMVAGGGGAAARPAAMAVFDATPPGALCAGLPACAPRGR